jgi:predicted ribosome quality control (RQC) complex YloA/Tae2 family protein
LVVAGRDKIQNDIIVKHYMQKGDIYFHANVHGAASVLLKNPTELTVSPISIQ